MKKTSRRFALRACALAVHALCLSLAGTAAWALDDNEEVRALTQPQSRIELGAGYVDRASTKFGEYNGLDRKGGFGIAGFELYSAAPQDSTWRWKLTGTDLGLDNRSLQGEFGNQGRFRISLGYQEMPHLGSDTYHTIWQGAGSTSLTLNGYPAASARGTTPALANWNNIQSPYPDAASATAGGATAGHPIAGSPAALVLANFTPFEVGTTRKRMDLGGLLNLGPGWDLRASARHETKDGTKLTGISFGATSRGALLPEPVDSSTDILETSLGYNSKTWFGTVTASGSSYHNHVNAWSADSPFANNAVRNNVARMVGAPDNQMLQIGLNGGYRFTPTTQLVLSLTRARLTQNEAFLPNPDGSAPTGGADVCPNPTTLTAWCVPATSANAKVTNTQYYARLTSRPMPRLALSATYRHDDRRNDTPVLDLRVAGADGAGNTSVFTNEPNQRHVQSFAGEADYALTPGQSLKGGLDWQRVTRHGSVYEETPFRAERVRETTARLEYRATLNDMLSGRLSYARGQRRNSGYIEGEIPSAEPQLPTFQQFWLANRDRDRVRASLSFQPADAWSLQANVEHTQDRYPDMQYGTKRNDSNAATVDAAWTPSETFSANAYITSEETQQRLQSYAIARVSPTSIIDLTHAAGQCGAYATTAGHIPIDYMTDPCRNWSATQADHVITLGLGFKAGGFWQNRLSITGDLSYARAHTPIGFTGGTYFSNGALNVWIPVAPVPAITSEMTELKLTGTYAVGKADAVRVGWTARHLSSSDFQLDAYASNPTVMQGFIGTGMTSPRYTVNVVGLAWIHTFR